MYESVAYRRHVKPKLRAMGVADCGSWPQDVLDLNNLEGRGACCYG